MEGRVYSREDIVQALDDEIDKNVRQWGPDYIYTKWARENKERTLTQYDAGMVVLVEKESYHRHGMDWEIEFYSDGTTKEICYGYMD